MAFLPPPPTTPLLGSPIMPYADLASPLHCHAYFESPITPNAHLILIYSPWPMFTFRSFLHHAYSPGIPPLSLCLPYMFFLLGIKGVAGIETLGEPHMTLILYCPKGLGSHELLCPPPPHQPLPCLDSQSCPMLTWRPFPHHTPC